MVGQDMQSSRFLALQELSGRWVVEPNPRVRDSASISTLLQYELHVLPRWSLPSTLVSCVVRAGLPANVRAIAARAEQVGPLVFFAASMRAQSALMMRAWIMGSRQQ